jgi:hypothetical protein
MVRLKAAYDAGYYRTEAAIGEQTPLPRVARPRARSTIQETLMSPAGSNAPITVNAREDARFGEATHPRTRGVSVMYRWQAISRWWRWLCSGRREP